MKVFISTSSFAKYDDLPLRLLRDAGLDIQLNPYGRKLAADECLSLYADIDGVIAGTETLSAEILRSAGNLKIVSRCGAGTDSVDMEAARALGISVFTTPDAPTQAVAELTVGLMLALLRGISRADRLIRTGAWRKDMGSLLCGKTLGILGLGRIGKAVAELTQPFGLRYLAWDIAPDRQFAGKHTIELVGLDDLLGNTDIISIHLPYAPELKGIIGRRAFSLMKKDALLVNTSRGGLIDEAALYEALKERKIAGAALDVFEQEPYTGPLRQLDNVILTAHIGSYAREARVEMEIEAARNLIAGLENA